MGVAVDAFGNLFIADTGNDRIREVRTDGKIITIAGDVGFDGDGGPAFQAQLNHPEGVAVDAQGNLYIADTGNNRIRRVIPIGVDYDLRHHQYFRGQRDGCHPQRAQGHRGTAPPAASSSPITGSNQIVAVPAAGVVMVEGGGLSLPPPSNTQPSILLVGAQNSSLALIATLVVTSLNGGESQDHVGWVRDGKRFPNQAIAPSGKGGEGAHAADESANPHGRPIHPDTDCSETLGPGPPRHQ